MTSTTLLLYGFELVAALSAIAILVTRQVFHAALWLIICLLSIAALYVFASAELLAVAQILVYAGGIVVLLIFGIMLTSQQHKQRVSHQHILPALLAGGFLLILLVRAYSGLNLIMPMEQRDENSVTATGMALMQAYALPFEVVGFLLLIALVGAAVVASAFTKQKDDGAR